MNLAIAFLVHPCRRRAAARARAEEVGRRAAEGAVSLLEQLELVVVGVEHPVAALAPRDAHVRQDVLEELVRQRRIPLEHRHVAGLHRLGSKHPVVS